MSILKVARLGHPILRGVAQPVPIELITTTPVQRLIDDMIATMQEYQGVGLAAIQVHEPVQMVVIEVDKNPRYPQAPAIPLTVLINLSVAPLGEELEEDWEGCLSVPDLRGRVPRYHGVLLKGRNRLGEEISEVARGFYARVLQHECDHLQGRVFLDRMPSLQSLTHLGEFNRFWGGQCRPD